MVIGNRDVPFLHIDIVKKEDSIPIVKVTEEDFGIFIPNVFTPNGDGINDTFKVSAPNCSFEMQIYNRWGEIIYSGSSWSGGTSPEGYYIYMINIVGINHRHTFLKGYILLEK